MAYTALRSLSQVLGQALIHDAADHEFPLHLNREKLLLLQDMVTITLTFLKEYPHSKAIDLLESRVIDVAYAAEDVIEPNFISQTSQIGEHEASFEFNVHLNVPARAEKQICIFPKVV